MTRLVIADAARADLQAIARHTESEGGPAQRKRYLSAHVAERHVIFYRIDHRTVIVLRVLHQHMDVKKHL